MLFKVDLLTTAIISSLVANAYTSTSVDVKLEDGTIIQGKNCSDNSTIGCFFGIPYA